MYNTRLITLEYFYIKETKEDVESKVIDKELDKEINKFFSLYLTNTSKNYFRFLNTIQSCNLALNRKEISTKYTIDEIRPNIIKFNSIE